MCICRHTCLHVYFSDGECIPLKRLLLFGREYLFTSRVKIRKRCLLGRRFIYSWNRLLKDSHLCEMDSLNVNFCDCFVSSMCILRFLLFTVKANYLIAYCQPSVIYLWLAKNALRLPFSLPWAGLLLTSDCDQLKIGCSVVDTIIRHRICSNSTSEIQK